ncbi:hypothetical protein CPLU01_13814 [Colletotrichum plurivorum]|uniref:Uncharacterized protein n=1 Tax=Colletotrichum plurivorum TaxID=2175906 RepID=A0A8H6N1Z8_9PEZI|nr:hypothetical protein CPLU01_13814 [Colletotrichum plurivorum]
MQFAVIQHYYSNLKSNSLETGVDILWNNILRLYFDIRKSYGLDPQQRSYQGVVKTRSDLIITVVRNDQHEKVVVLIQDKCVGHEQSALKWEEAVEQVTDYMKAARTSNCPVSSKAETIYAIVTVGRCSRFYELLPGEHELTDYDNTDGKAYEFKEVEESVDGILLDIVKKTSH